MDCTKGVWSNILAINCRVCSRWCHIQWEISENEHFLLQLEQTNSRTGRHKSRTSGFIWSTNWQLTKILLFISKILRYTVWQKHCCSIYSEEIVITFCNVSDIRVIETLIKELLYLFMTSIKLQKKYLVMKCNHTV